MARLSSYSTPSKPVFGRIPKKRFIVFTGIFKKPVAQVKTLSEAKEIAEGISSRTGRVVIVARVGRLGSHFAYKYSGWGDREYYPDELTAWQVWNTKTGLR